jgi:hypothetical protein
LLARGLHANGCPIEYRQISTKPLGLRRRKANVRSTKKPGIIPQRRRWRRPQRELWMKPISRGLRPTTGIHPARKHEEFSYESLAFGNPVKGAWHSSQSDAGNPRTRIDVFKPDPIKAIERGRDEDRVGCTRGRAPRRLRLRSEFSLRLIPWQHSELFCSPVAREAGTVWTAGLHRENG